MFRVSKEKCMPPENQIETENGSNGKLLYDINETSTLLSVSKITVRRLVARKHLHRQPNVRKLLFSRQELERFATAS
jgi:hypothetical protein